MIDPPPCRVIVHFSCACALGPASATRSQREPGTWLFVGEFCAASTAATSCFIPNATLAHCRASRCAFAAALVSMLREYAQGAPVVDAYTQRRHRETVVAGKTRKALTCVMTLGQFISILQARWRSALLVLLVTVCAAVAVSLLLPKKYTATASVMLDVRSPDPIGGTALAGMMAPAYMATQVDLISSERVARRAIQTLGLADNAATREQWHLATKGQGNFEAWLADTLLKHLDVKPSRESNVITIGYASPDPNFSAAYQCLCPGLCRHHRRIARGSGTPVQQLLRCARQEAARRSRGRPGQAVRIPGEQGPAPDRRASRCGNHAPGRTLVAARDAAILGRRIRRPPGPGRRPARADA